MNYIPIRWSAESGAGDWSPDSAEVSDLQIAVMISLFTDRQARPDDVIPDGSTDARGWWGKPNIGSRLWLLERAKATEATRQQARDYMTEALQWLIDDGAVARFEIDTGYSRSGRLDAQIIAYRQDGTTHAMRFEWAWPKCKRSTHALYPSHINRTPPAGRAGFGRRCALAVLQSAHRWGRAGGACASALRLSGLDCAPGRAVYRRGRISGRLGRAEGRVSQTSAGGAVIPKGAPLVRSDGMTFTTQTSALVDAEGTATVEVQAESDPAGLSGAAGNTPVGTPMTLGTAIAGVQSNGLVQTPLTGGTDLESDDSLRRRMLAAYQQPPQGGSQTDYVQWALQVEGVTRAWCAPQGFGIGTVVVYIMCDQSQAEQAGFPQGEDGVAQDEPRGVAASGDQLRVANHLYVLQPVTALVYVVSPLAHRVDVEI